MFLINLSNNKKPIATKIYMPDSFKSPGVLYVINFINDMTNDIMIMKSIPGFDLVVIEILDLSSTLNNAACILVEVMLAKKGLPILAHFAINKNAGGLAETKFPNVENCEL